MRGARFALVLIVSAVLIAAGPLTAAAKLTFAPGFDQMLYEVDVLGHTGSPICYGLVTEGDRAYASTYSGVEVFDLSSGDAVLVGDYVDPWGGPDALALSGADLWAASGSDVGRFDCSDPASITPVEASFVDLGPWLRRVRALEVTGSSLLVAGDRTGASSSSLFVLSISNPSAPVVRSITVGALSFLRCLDVEGGLAYGGTGGGSGAILQVIDIANLSSPEVTGSVAVEADAAAHVEAVAVAYGHAYVACASDVDTLPGGLAIVDVGDPVSPSLVATPGAVGRAKDAVDVRVSGDALYVLYREEREDAPDLCELVVFDISTPTAPVETASFDDISGLLEHPRLAMGGGGLLLGDSHGLAAFGGDPLDPSVTSRWRAPSVGVRIRESGGFACVTDWDGFLHVVDLSEPGTPTPLGHVAVSGDGAAMGLDISGAYAFYSVDTSEAGSLYAPSGSGAFRVADVSNPAAPSLERSLATTWTAYDLRVSGGVAYAGTAGGGLVTLDVSDPVDPAILGGVSPDVPSGLPVHVPGVAISGSRAYMTYADGGFGDDPEHFAVAVVDVSDPAAPSVVSTFGPTGATSALIGAQVDDDFLYISGENGIFVYDLTHPDEPRRVGTSADFPAAWFEVAGTSICSGLGGGVSVLDIADPFDPRPVSFAGPFWTDIYNGAFSGSTMLAPGPGLWTGRSTAPTPTALDVRLAGSTRHGTAAKVSEYSHPEGARTVVIATGAGYPDALTGAPLAFALRAPLLLVAKDDVPAAVEAEIARLGAERAIVLGGTAAVSETVAAELRSLMGTTSATAVQRIAGPDRYATAASIAASLAAAAGVPDTAYVATGRNFPDALSVSGVASRLGRPILLVRPDSVPAPTAGALASLGVTRTVVLGGTTAVSDPVYTQVGGFERLSGPSRYATSRAIADHALANGFMPGRLYIATGRNFPDALAAGPACAAQRAPLLLVSAPLSQPALAPIRAYLDAHVWQVRTVVVIGGTGPMPQTLVDDVLLRLSPGTP